jgi:prepilin-type N-terminal cleavage/methylation domain-containing protein
MGKNARLGVRGRPAFTLIELLIVVIIIALLVALLLGAVLKAYQYALCVGCQHNLSQLAKSVMAYITASGGKIPPTVIRDTTNGDTFWCGLLVTFAGVDAQDMAAADARQATRIRSGQASVFICPASTETYVALADPWDQAVPIDRRAQGWTRLGNANHMYDCSYYWNGYTGNDATLMARFPSLALNTADTAAIQATQIHDVSEIKARSRLLMAADGVFFQDSGNNPERVAARHPIDVSTGGRTNLVFYDCHVDSMDRYPNPDWQNEVVSGYENPQNVDPARAPMVPIMTRKPKFDLSSADQDKTPAFFLPRH